MNEMPTTVQAPTTETQSQEIIVWGLVSDCPLGPAKESEVKSEIILY